jgi:hypothetical protein
VTQDPARLPRIRFEARSWAKLVRRTPSPRGAWQALRPFTFPEHPSARTMISGPVRTSDLLRRCDSAPRRALRPFLGTAPRCLESVSTTDVSRHEHPPETPLPETARQAPWETRQRPTSRPNLCSGVSADRSRTAPDHLAVIQPPANSMLDGMAPASGRAACPPFSAREHRVAIGAPRASSAAGDSAGSNPLTPLADHRASALARLLPDCREPLLSGARQCDRPSRARGAFHRERPSPVPLRARVWGVASAGRQRQSPHVFIAVSKNVD